MSTGYYNLNDVQYDDDTRIIGFERENKGPISIGEIIFDFYVIRLKYQDGTYKDMRVYCEYETSKKLANEQEKNYFFIKRLFGKNGLIIKEKRNDYIFLGGINKDQSSGARYSRYNIGANGKTMQRIFSELFLYRITPHLSKKNIGDDWDVLNMEYFFHSGTEDMISVFKKGLRSRFGKSDDGFCRFGDTATPAYWGAFCENNGLYSAIRRYGDRNKGSHVFIIRIPKEYRGSYAEDGSICPPMPTHRMVDFTTGDCYIIPEIIYGMYDTISGILYKNPNYNTKYNPNGLSYDHEAVWSLQFQSPKWYNFAKQRIGLSYKKLKIIDELTGTFKEVCDYHGISYGISGAISQLLGSTIKK